MGKSAGNVVAVACVGLLFAVLFLLFSGGFDFYQAAGFLYSFAGKAERVFLCALAVSAFGLLYVALGGEAFSLCRDKAVKILMTVVFLGAFVLQMYFLFYVRSCYKWDSGFVIGGASSLVQNGTVAEQAQYYLSVYPNQNTFVCITAALIRLSDLLGVSIGNRPLIFNLFNTICLDLSLVLSLAIMKKWKPQLDRKQFARILILMLCNPFVYLGVSYYYTITLSLPFTMGFLLLVMEKTGKADDENSQRDNSRNDSSLRKRDRILKWILAGVLLGVGYELRATAVIIGIAAAITGVRRLLEFKVRHKNTDAGISKGSRIIKSMLVKFMIIAVTAILTASGLNTVQNKYVGIDTRDTAFPATHWLMMSLTMPGSHNAEDEAFTASFATKEEKAAAVKTRIGEKLEAMSFSDYAALVKTKVQNTFGNGMNGYNVFLAEALRTDGIYEVVFGGHKDFVILWHQGYYLFMMLGILLYAGRWLVCKVQTWKAKATGQEEDFNGFFLLLILLGAILFYVLWEASEQYSVPFMMIMNCLGFMGFSEWEPGNGENEREKNKKIGQKLCRVASIIGLGLAAAILIWGMARFPRFTSEESAQSYKAAVQILANTSYPVDDGWKLSQTVEIKRPFNRLIIQWRNPAMEESTAQYRVELRERTNNHEDVNADQAVGKIVFAADIDATGTGYNGAGIYDFETVVPDDADYEIVMYKVAGDPQHDLEFVVYDMPGYTPYSLGRLSLETIGNEGISAGNGEELTASLLFSLSEEKTEPYASVKNYIFFISVIFLLFLFVGFWCKLRVVSFTKEEQ